VAQVWRQSVPPTPSTGWRSCAIPPDQASSARSAPVSLWMQLRSSNMAASRNGWGFSESRATAHDPRSPMGGSRVV